MEALLDVPGPLDLARTLSRFQRWGEDPVNRLSDGVFRRAVRVGARWHGYELRWTGGAADTRVIVAVPGARSPRVLAAAVAEARRICGADLDLEAFYRAAKEDPVLGELAPRLHGLRPTLMPEPFEMLVGAICAQQVNLTFAFALRAALVRRYGTVIRVGGETVYAFPEPAALARARVRELRRMKFSGRKAEYIIGLARRIDEGELDLVALSARTNEEIIEALTAVRGLGRWTAEWFLARGLGRGDVCPAGDLAVRKAFAHFYNRGRGLSDRAIRRRAARWGAHQNLAVHYLLAGQRLVRADVGGGT
jgi:3-methyladenine DNA glycosylase/8-oxoguanine DNA glycosylase